MYAERRRAPSQDAGPKRGGGGHCRPPQPPPAPPRSPDELLHAIALEELAIAHLINVEAEKAQATARQRITALTPDELIAFQKSIARVLEQLVEKEKLLLKKLRLLLAHRAHPDADDCT